MTTRAATDFEAALRRTILSAFPSLRILDARAIPHYYGYDHGDFAYLLFRASGPVDDLLAAGFVQPEWLDDLPPCGVANRHGYTLHRIKSGLRVALSGDLSQAALAPWTWQAIGRATSSRP
jgi:hypothetical protein